MKKQLPEPTAEDTANGFIAHGSWKGHPQLHCLLCAFDSLVEATMRKHVLDVHQMAVIAGQVETTPLSVPLYDHKGDLITER